jgi:hypothetical protein
VISEADFDRLIDRDWKVVRFYGACVGAMVVVAVASGVAGTFEWSDSERVKLMTGWGGACAATLGSVLPLRQAWPRIDRIIDLKTLRAKFLELKASKDPVDADLARIESIVWDIYAKVS